METVRQRLVRLVPRMRTVEKSSDTSRTLCELPEKPKSIFVAHDFVKRLPAMSGKA
jgi:hypothetical protein